MVLPNGPAKSPGALIATEDWDPGILKLVGRLQLVVGVIEVESSMEAVGALLGGDVHKS